MTSRRLLIPEGDIYDWLPFLGTAQSSTGGYACDMRGQTGYWHPPGGATVSRFSGYFGAGSAGKKSR